MMSQIKAGRADQIPDVFDEQDVEHRAAADRALEEDRDTSLLASGDRFAADVLNEAADDDGVAASIAPLNKIPECFHLVLFEIVGFEGFGCLFYFLTAMSGQQYRS